MPIPRNDLRDQLLAIIPRYISNSRLIAQKAKRILTNEALPNNAHLRSQRNCLQSQ